jgi:hypothetical protein
MKKYCSILLFILISVCGVSAFAEEEKAGIVTGKVMIKEGVPMANGVVFIFNDASGPPPALDKYWRVPDEIVKTDAEGRFTANLSEGKYYIGAIKRMAGEDIGPMQEGDLFLPFRGDSASKQYVIVGGTKRDLGTITGAVPYKKEKNRFSAGETAIEGVITDSRGRPVENALVFAFLTPAMVGKPLFISEKTGKDGHYVVRVHQGGDFYLKIRNFYGGGAMKAGEIMGSYGQEKPMAVEVKTGIVTKGINISGINFSGSGAK